MPVSPTSLALILCAALMTLVPPDSALAAAIRGSVVVAGAPQPPRKLPVTIDQYVCGKEKDAEDLVVGPQGGVRNAVAWLTNPPARGKWENPEAKVEMDQRGCVFVPRVVIVPAGGTVEFLNSDRLLHNLHSVAKDNPPFNRTQPKGRAIPVAFPRPEIIRVNCDLHSWMRAWVVVADHPYYALSNEAGEFTLPSVPPSTYTLSIWHETLGITTREVTVGPQDARVTVELKARP
jgi:plastocyanin